MKNIKIYIYILCCLLSTTLYAQQVPTETPRVLKVASSKLGNYIYLVGRDEIDGKDTTLLKATDHFIIKRMPFVVVTDSVKAKAAFKNIKTIGIAKKVATEKELKELLDDTYINDIKKFLKINTNKALLDFIATHVKSKDYGLVYGLTEPRIMLGHVYLDKDVKEGEVVYYQVIRVDKNKVEHQWGVAMAQSKMGNYSLDYLKPRIASVTTTDSTVDVTWKMKVSEAMISQMPKPKMRAAFDPDGNLLTVPYLLTSVGGRVTSSIGTNLIASKRLLPTLNATEDTLTFIYKTKIPQGEQFTAYLVAEDEIYNQGAHSDTTTAFGISNSSAPIIYKINVSEVTDGIRLSWDQLPVKPYITGIQILRYDSNDKLDTLGIKAATDTTFTDYAIKVGQTYRYHVKALFLPGMGLSQSVAAQGVGNYTKFAKPLPAYDLIANAQGNSISLAWKAADAAGFYGYFVYRGTSPKRMDLIAGPIKEKMYTDTAASLNGRSQYYYAIKTKNLRQDTSLYSNSVMIRPAKKIAIDPPADVLFYYANGALRIEWYDVRVRDNFIETFVLQKRKKGDTDYTTLKTRGANDAFYIDSLIQPGVAYQYRVASVSTTGELSAFSTAGEFGLENNSVPTVNLFYVRNITAGVEVSLPQVVYPNCKAYTIYRRNAAGGDFAKIATMNAETFIFTDSKTEKGQTYIYAISMIEKDDREGARGASVSVKR